MDRIYFLITNRLKFSAWNKEDLILAERLWGNPDVTKYICSSGVFQKNEIQDRLSLEIQNEALYHFQYWPVFKDDGTFIGCCGLRPHSENTCEIGFHFLPEFWHMGYAKEAAEAVIQYAIKNEIAVKLFAGHNPSNTASEKLLLSLGFIKSGVQYYPPTGLMHPSYELDIMKRSR